jgi:hypothetical protein
MTHTSRRRAVGIYRHSVGDLARELGRYLPAWPQGDITALALVGTVFGDIIVERHDLCIVVRDGRFYTAYKTEHHGR